MKQINISKLSKETQAAIKRELSTPSKVFPADLLLTIKENTADNYHLENYIIIAEALGDKSLLASIEAIKTLQKYFGGIDSDLNSVYNKIRKNLMTLAERTFSNYEDLYNVL